MTEKEKKMCEKIAKLPSERQGQLCDELERAELTATNEEAERGHLAAAAAAAALSQCSLSTVRFVYGYIRGEVSFGDQKETTRAIISMLQDLRTPKLNNLYYLVLHM